MRDIKIVSVSIMKYGKVNINLKAIMEQRGVTRNALAKSSNTRFDVVNKWYKNDVEKADLDVLARFCYALDCEPSDILTYSMDE